MWVKICGLTDAAAVAAALQAGADAIGFVFAPSSVRAVVPVEAAALAASARGRCQLVAVTLHPAQALIDEILRDFRPDVLQSDWADLGRLRLPTGLALLPVLREPAAGNDPRQSALPGRVLYEGARSGTGTRPDWGEAQRLARHTELILAGGLHAHNVMQAIQSVRPYGVDVSTGVELSPGRKSPALIAQFIAAARAVAQDAA